MELVGEICVKRDDADAAFPGKESNRRVRWRFHFRLLANGTMDDDFTRNCYQLPFGTERDLRMSVTITYSHNVCIQRQNEISIRLKCRGKLRSEAERRCSDLMESCTDSCV